MYFPFVVVVCHYQDHQEVVDVSNSTKHRPVDVGVPWFIQGTGVLGMEPRGNGHVVLVAGDGVPHKETEQPVV